jgi:MFS family permease
VHQSLTPFRGRQFRLLFASRTVSMLGDGVSTLALAFAVLQVTGSAADVGFVFAVRAVPLVVLLLAGGVWSDRLPRQAVMVGADLVRASTQGLMAALVITGTAQLWQLIALGLLHGSATAFYSPASVGITPQTVPRDSLQEANSLLFTSFSAASIVGPLVGGALVATIGAGYGLALDASTFVVSAMLLAPLKLDRLERVRATFLEDLRLGWQQVRRRKWLWVSILDFSFFQFIVYSSLYVLGPVVAKRSLGGAASWAAISSCLGIGLVVGSVIALRIRPRYPLRLAFAATLLVAPALALLGTATSTVAIAVAMVPAGATIAIGQTLWSTTLQQKVPGAVLSRVSSYDVITSTALRPVGYALAGPIAVAFGPRATLVGAAALFVLLELAALSVSDVRNLRAGFGDLVPGTPVDPSHAVATVGTPAVGR